MFKTIFQKAGLTPTQADILEFLYGKKEEKASVIAKQIKKSRAIVYKDLDEMVALNLIEREEKAGQVSFFRLGHPSQMEKFFDQKEAQIKKDRQQFENYLPDMVSQFNLLSNKPGVRLYEGLEGVNKALDDTLKRQTEIYTYSDIYSTGEEAKKLNENYVKRRIKLQINKKILTPESNRDLFTEPNQEFTKVKFLKAEFNPFKTAMQIYDGKVSYQTLDEVNNIAVIIEDKNIYSLHKGFFEFVWDKLAND